MRASAYVTHFLNRTKHQDKAEQIGVEMLEVLKAVKNRTEFSTELYKIIGKPDFRGNKATILSLKAEQFGKIDAEGLLQLLELERTLEDRQEGVQTLSLRAA